MNQLKGYCTLALILYFLLSGQQSMAQNANAKLIPKVLPTTPEAASLGRFGSYPVSHFTGLANISIPLYEVSAGGITVPISISYHPSGIKVTDRSSWVGLGWALETGGTISRKMMGPKADERTEGYIMGQTLPPGGQVDPFTDTGVNYLRDVNNGTIDTEPDIFSYSFPGGSGKFLFNQRQNNRAIMIPYNPVKVVKVLNASNLSFELYDEHGNNYKYEAYEETVHDDLNARTSWMPTKMISTDKQDTVKFNYTSRFGTVSQDWSDYITVDDLVINGPSSGGEWDCSQDFSATLAIENKTLKGIMATELKVSEISFPLGKVVFTPSTSDRQDGFSGQKKLDKIEVYLLDPATNTYETAPTKTIRFYQSYFISTGQVAAKRLRLDSLQIHDKNNTLVQRYKFEYETSTVLPDYSSRERDYWGYFNNKPNNILVPRQDISYQTSGASQPTTLTIGSNFANGRDPDSTYMQACILKKIFFPTGGRTEFTYETNRYKDDANQKKYAGGLRLKQVKSYANNTALPIVKTFKYGLNESGYGRPNFLMVNYYFNQTVTYRKLCTCGGYSTMRKRTFAATPSIEIEPYDGSPIVYPVVTEYEGDESNNIGKTVYAYTDIPDVLNTTVALGEPVINSYHFRRGLLSGQTIYKNNGGNSYQKTKELTNQYQAFSDSLISSIGFKVKKNIVTIDRNSGAEISLSAGGSCIGDATSYTYNQYSISTGDNKLISSTETTFDQTNVAKSFSVTTSYAYNNYLHQQVTSTSTTNSAGETLTSSVKYPHESSGSVYTEMIQKNLLAYPVEEKTTRNSTQLEKITRNYFKFSDYVFEPQTIYRQIKNGNDDLEITFTGYDLKGNILGYVSKENVPQTFLWGYKNNYPIAAAVGASQGEIFYTSFEEGTSSSISANAAKTGNRSWWNTAYTTPTMNAGTYKLTYWRKVGATQWEYVETTISGSTTIGGLNTYVDEVRICPVKARMTTYTFKPGIGMTSMIDTNNQIISYEYDAFSRLNTIRDFNKDILKRYVYNYKK